MKPGNEVTSREMAAGYNLLTIGITFALTVAGLVYLGVTVDRRQGTTPLWTIVGSLLGIGLGGYWMYLRLRRAEQQG